MTIWSLAQRAIAVAGLVALSPVFVIIAAAVRLTSAGPIIHRAGRAGRGGTPITVHKFRTMIDDASQTGPAITRDDDARITRVGGWLRRRRIDELPQLWDVARGAMALVGPRPEALPFVDPADPAWQTVLTVRPGITGPTQLLFRDESALLTGDDPERTYREEVLPRKLALDVAYVRGRSVRGDVAVLRRTLQTVLGGR